MSSPPLTPIRQYVPSASTSPMQRHSLSRRSSSFGDGHSPARRRSSYFNKRLSNASRYSNSIDELQTPVERSTAHSNGLGNLADELDFADEDWDDDDAEAERSLYSAADEMGPGHASHDKDNIDSSMLQDDGMFREPTQTDGARDSGIDVGYQSSPSPSLVKFSSGPFRKTSNLHKPQRIISNARSTSENTDGDEEDRFSLELEDAMSAIARLADPTTHQKADTTARTIADLQDLGAQTMLETQSHRLTTSMNSLSAHLVQQTKVITSLSSSLLSAFAFAPLLDSEIIDDLLPMLAQLHQEVPLPDPRALQGLAKLNRETGELLQTFSGLIDSLQMGKHTVTSAARHLKVTQTMVTELRRERERSDEARYWLDQGNWDQKLDKRLCASECKDVISGFEQVCDGLRRGLEESAAG